MKVAILLQNLRTAAKISNPSSLAPLYKSIELGDDTLRACSEFGNIGIIMNDKTGLTSPCLLDTDAVLAVVQSLPDDAEIKIEQKGNQVNWRCSRAKGYWVIVNQEYPIPPLDHTNYPWQNIPMSLPDALTLVSATCQAATVSIGAYGITLEPTKEGLKLISSNTISLTAVTLPPDGYPGGKITLRPPIPGIFSYLTKSYSCDVDVTDEGIYISEKTGRMVAQLSLASKLDHDLLAISNKYQTSEIKAEVNTDAIKCFLTRAKGLIDKHTESVVEMKVENGHLYLEHKGIAASGDEEFDLADGFDPTLKFSSVAFPIDMLLLPLERVKYIVFDHLPQKALVLKGDVPTFQYVVSGQ